MYSHNYYLRSYMCSVDWHQKHKWGLFTKSKNEGAHGSYFHGTYGFYSQTPWNDIIRQAIFEGFTYKRSMTIKPAWTTYRVVKIQNQKVLFRDQKNLKSFYTIILFRSHLINVNFMSLAVLNRCWHFVTEVLIHSTTL